MPIRPRVKAGYEDFPLSVNNRIWLHQSRWSEREYSWFYAQRTAFSLQMDRHPAHFHPKRPEIVGTVSAWILQVSEEQTPRAWVELHTFKGPRFTNGYTSAGGSDLQSKDDLAPLLRLIFLVGQLDQMLLICPQDVHGSFLKLLGQEKTLLTMPFKPWTVPFTELVALKGLAISRQEWLSCSELKDAGIHTRHIESRLERQLAVEKSGKGRKKKRGLLARIFRPRIDDSFF